MPIQFDRHGNYILPMLLFQSLYLSHNFILTHTRKHNNHPSPSPAHEQVIDFPCMSSSRSFSSCSVGHRCWMVHPNHHEFVSSYQIVILPPSCPSCQLPSLLPFCSYYHREIKFSSPLIGPTRSSIQTIVILNVKNVSKVCNKARLGKRNRRLLSTPAYG